jgi:hypothetical protein
MKVWIVVCELTERITTESSVEGAFASEELAVEHIESLSFTCGVSEFGDVNPFVDPDDGYMAGFYTRFVPISPTTSNGMVWRLCNPDGETVFNPYGYTWHIEEYEVVGA